MTKLLYKCALFVLICFSTSSCNDEVTQPKPRGYYRIDLPEHAYQSWSGPCPFEFKVSRHASMKPSEKNKNECFFDLEYPQFNATIYLSYLTVDNNLKALVDQEFTMREKHNAFSTGVSERVYKDSQNSVNAMLFDVKGIKAATPLQFFVTDSTSHFFRGALYFYNSPNNDSLAPVIKYIKADIDTLVSSFSWRQ